MTERRAMVPRGGKTFEGVRCIECGAGIVRYYASPDPKLWRAECVTGHLRGEVDVARTMVSVPQWRADPTPGD